MHECACMSETPIRSVSRAGGQIRAICGPYAGGSIARLAHLPTCVSTSRHTASCGILILLPTRQLACISCPHMSVTRRNQHRPGHTCGHACPGHTCMSCPYAWSCSRFLCSSSNRHSNLPRVHRLRLSLNGRHGVMPRPIRKQVKRRGTSKHKTLQHLHSTPRTKHQ